MENQLEEEPFLEGDIPTEENKFIFSAMAYACGIDILQEGTGEKTALIEAAAIVEKKYWEMWDKCRIEMLGRLETLKYETEGNQRQKIYNEAISAAQDQINIPALPVELWKTTNAG